MDSKYVTPFVLIALAFCFQAFGFTSVWATPGAYAPELEIPAAFTRV
jgi:hypothetical protein